MAVRCLCDFLSKASAVAGHELDSDICLHVLVPPKLGVLCIVHSTRKRVEFGFSDTSFGVVLVTGVKEQTQPSGNPRRRDRLQTFFSVSLHLESQ